MATTTPVSLRISDDELGALDQLAAAEQLNRTEFLMRMIRLGVQLSTAQAMQDFESHRRLVDRDIERKQFKLIAQCTMMLQDLAEKSGLDVGAIREDATDYGDEHFADGDALELAIADLQTEAANV